MTRNMHLLKTKNPHFINARSYLSKVQICCYRYMLDECGNFDECKSCDPEFKKRIDEELKDLKEEGRK
ncbi:MAG: hypothetical protein QIT40_gp40 [Lokiarchaeia virus VerdaV4]|uniref:Uncharacterized protein n=1 Tax=Lokiarchaeia virus VerdaV4 TaxID=3070172 RepID=A0AA35CNT0_9CAUD|nr:MAG: hypothetical protein QIT40_gp40 [Lokiarchaeia virus VerdaV4]BDI54998.1 MAG: hypothetical protein [Lokiarchaeia virus VerdaV4]